MKRPRTTDALYAGDAQMNGRAGAVDGFGFSRPGEADSLLRRQKSHRRKECPDKLAAAAVALECRVILRLPDHHEIDPVADAEVCLWIGGGHEPACVAVEARGNLGFGSFTGRHLDGAVVEEPLISRLAGLQHD